MRRLDSEVFVDGPLSPEIISQLLVPSSGATETATEGAQSIFMGRVRSDIHDGKKVVELQYESYRAMAEPIFESILAETKEKFDLTALMALHSLGSVPAGELCFAVGAWGARRAGAIDGCRAAVERIKKEVPIYAKELLEDGTHKWKRNS